MAEVLPITGGSLTHAERTKRVVEILDRKYDLDAEWTDHENAMHSIDLERDELDRELADLTGTQRQLPLPTVNGTGRKCKLCGETGHISRDGKCKTFPNGKPMEN